MSKAMTNPAKIPPKAPALFLISNDLFLKDAPNSHTH